MSQTTDAVVLGRGLKDSMFRLDADEVQILGHVLTATRANLKATGIGCSFMGDIKESEFAEDCEPVFPKSNLVPRTSPLGCLLDDRRLILLALKGPCRTQTGKTPPTISTLVFEWCVIPTRRPLSSSRRAGQSSRSTQSSKGRPPRRPGRVRRDTLRRNHRDGQRRSRTPLGARLICSP